MIWEIPSNNTVARFPARQALSLLPGRGRGRRPPPNVSLLFPVDVLADAPDAGHLLLVERPGVQSFEIVLHLRCGGGARGTDVHVGMGENEAVAVGWGQRSLAGRYELGVEELAPAGGGEDYDARPLLPRQVREDVLFGAWMHGVVADLKEVHRRLHLSSGDLAKEGPLVAGHAHEAHLAAVPESMHTVDELLAWRFAQTLYDHEIDLLDLELLEPALHIVLQEESSEGRPGQHDAQLVAVPGGEVADGPHHMAPLEKRHPQVVDAVLIKRLLDGGGGYAVARRQPDPAHHQSCPAEGNLLLEIHLRPPFCQAGGGFAFVDD